ncbi:hypothetical protein QWY85_20605 [Neolewinella lacunae]|uniref:Uncharacterized protein n=1 Tax=Neolewinella lacunae TaxID=1517758 RepID=A0A923PGX5_9BACT|nr:hypothetical protein [Neolewinella lacunae]MBC6993855.1 hypothetical protein [Neolewinella lacunae]MDN3637084.1 hypothetical protein [Neolewinella lacunae]
MWSILKKKRSAKMVSIKASFSYQESFDYIFNDFIIILLSAGLRTEGMFFDYRRLKVIPDRLKKSYLSTPEVIEMMSFVFEEKEPEIYLSGDKYFSEVLLPETFTFSRTISPDKAFLGFSFAEGNLDVANLDKFIGEFSNKQLDFVSLVDVEYGLSAKENWQKAYYPSEHNGFVKGDESVWAQSPIVYIDSIGIIPWTASTYWFGSGFFAAIDKSKVMSFAEAEEITELPNGVVKMVLHKQLIVDSDKENTRKRAAFKRHLGIEWPK